MNNPRDEQKEAARMGEKQEPWYVGAQNDALFIIAGKAPATSNDFPDHDAAREVIARVFDEQRAAFIVSACNSHTQLLARCAELETDFAQAMEALESLSFECDGVTHTRPPANDTYNRTYDVLFKLRMKHNAGKAYGGPSGTLTRAALASQGEGR